MGQTLSLDSTNDQVTMTTAQAGQFLTPSSSQFQILQGPEGPRGKDAVVDYTELANSVVTNPQLYGVVRDGLVRDQQFQSVVTQYFKDNAILFRGEKGVTEFKSLSFDEKASIVNMIIQQNKDDFVKGFVESQDLKKAIVDSLAKIPEIRGIQGLKGDKGDKGEQGLAGKDAVVDYPKLTQSVITNSQMLDAVRSGLIVDPNFKGVITKYFQDNAVLFRGEKGVTEFKALSVDEKAAIVTMIVQQNKAEFAKGLGDNKEFRQAIIDALVIRPELKGPQGDRGAPGPAGPAGKDAVVDYVQLGNVVSTTPAFAGSISSRLATRSDFAKLVSDNQDLRKNVVDQISLRPEFKGPQGPIGPVGPPGKDADGFVGMWIAQRFQRGGVSDFISNPYSIYGVRPSIETALIGTMNLDDKCRFTGNAIWQSANLGYNAVYSTRMLVTSNFSVSLDNVRGTSPFSIFINGRRANGQFVFESGTWYTIELFHGVESSGQDAFVELGWNPKNLKQNIGTVVAVMRNGLMGSSTPAPSTFEANRVLGNFVAGQQVSFDGSLIRDGTIPFQKFGVGESLPVRMMPMIPDSKIAAVSAPKITGPGTLDYSLLPTINDDKISGVSASKIGGAAGSLNYNLLPSIRNDKLIDNDIEGKRIKDGSLSTSKLTGVFGDAMLLDNTISGGKIKDGTLSTSKLNGRIGDNMFDDNSLNGGKIKDGTLSTSKLIGNIDASRITNLSIPTGFNPQRDQLSGASIQNDTITSDKIKSVDFAKVTGNIDGSRVSGNIDSSKIVGNIDGSRISGNVDGSKISGNLDGSKISGNIDSSKIKGLPNSFPGWRVSNRDNLEFGVGIAGKQADAGKIGYNVFSDGLDIVGSGGLPRKVTIWDNLEVKGSVTANSITSSSGASLDYEQFTKATSGRRIGNWNGADENNNSWDPAFRGARTGYIHNTAEGDANAKDSYVEFDVPQGMKHAYVVYLPWSNGRYFSIFGINNANQEVFVRRVDSTGVSDVNNSGNHNGVTAASVAGVNRFKSIRVRGEKGRMHLMGVGWTREEGRGMETGFINADNVRPGTFSGGMTFNGSATFNDMAWFKAGKNTPSGWMTHLPFTDGNNYIRGDTQFDAGTVTFNNSVNFNGAVGGNGIRVGDTHLRHDDDWIRLVNAGGRFNNDNNGYNRGFAAKNIWARDKIIADGGIVEMKGGWSIDSTDGHLRFRKNGTNVFTVHDNGNIWSAEQGWMVGDKWTYQLETYPRGNTTDHRCVDVGGTDKPCNWQSPWRRFRMKQTPYQDNTRSY